jgi:hypothetical protein
MELRSTQSADGRQVPDGRDAKAAAAADRSLLLDWEQDDLVSNYPETKALTASSETSLPDP